MSKFAAGLIGIVIIVLVSYGAYTKFANPFASSFTVHATFPNANGLRPGSLVRIAGVNVGKVTGIDPVPGCQVGGQKQGKCEASDVTLQIENQGLPLHQDATFWIRPRIFLEGNFFVDISPGSPSSPTVGDGYTFPIQAGREPVQFDQLLSALQSNTRKNLQVLLEQYGIAVKQGGPDYNASVQYWKPAYQYSAIVSHDFLGYQPHDLSNYIDQAGAVASALDTNPKTLQSLVHDLNVTAGSFAAQQANLQAAVAELPVTLRTAVPALNALNTAFPPLRQLARTLVPGVVSSGPSIDAQLPFVAQLRQLVQPSELGGLAHDLSYAVPSLAQLSQATIPLMKQQVRPLSSCVATKILPWSHLTVPDSHFNSSDGFPDRQVYIEGVDFLPGLAGESRNFDANGPYIRIIGVGGTLTYSFTPGMFGQSLAPISGVQPGLAPGGKRPPLHSNTPCETQQTITSLYAPTTGAGSAAVDTGKMSAAGQAYQASAAHLALDNELKQAKAAGINVNTTPGK